MCGIAGFTHADRRSGPERIWGITRSLTHRGPDRQDVWESAHISLGAVRLKIIDLEHGDQPMASDDGGTILAFNGEIYNHAALRRELEGLGHRFHSRCDTEVVLRAFLEWDVESFARLRGMFAAALWTEPQRRLILVRDRMGIKPLYFRRHGGNLYFGSEMKAILLHPELDRQLNPAALERYLAFNYVPGTATLVEGIEKLAPGHWLEWKDSAASIHSYWTLDFRPDASLDLESAKEELDRLLRSAVEEHLISDAPLGVWSSGGLDSSAILHYAAEASPARLKTFSVSFRGRSFDEARYFREVAERYHTDHHEFDLNPDADLRGAIEQFADYSDEPSADAGALPVWFLSKMCRQEVTVALSGDGADELFGGYNTYLADRYARALRRFPRPLLRGASSLARLLPVSDDKIGLDYKVTRMLQGALLEPFDAHFYWNGTFGAAERRALLTHAGGPASELPLPPESSGGLNRFLWLDQLCYLPDDILNKCDRMSMAHSLEVRPPFLDHRIVEFAARLPENFKIRGGSLKFILRELMRGKLPRAVIARGKEGFDIPAHHWLRTSLKPLLTQTLNERTVRQSGIFQWETIDRVLRSHFERRANLGYHLWGLLLLFLWMKRWEIQPPREWQASSQSRRRKRYELTVLAVAAAVFIACIVSPPSLMDDSDAVLVQIARNMLDSGDWVTARLDGIAYLEKSPLIEWLMVASFKIFGVHDWAARLPVALSAVGLCWLTFRMGAWAFSLRAGLYAGLILATSIGLWLFTRIQIPDVTVTLTIALAMWGFLRALDSEEQRPGLWSAIMAAAMGLGLLLKGLIAMVFPVAAAVLYLVFSRQLLERQTWKRLHIFRGALIALAIAAPWHVLATLRNPPYFDFSLTSGPGHYRGFFWFYFFNEHILRFLNLRYPRDYNTVPRVYFWLFHLLWLFPWSVYFPAVWKLPFRGADRASRMRLLCLCWAGFLLVFFTFSSTQEYYSMPCYPALALLLGPAMTEDPAARWRRRGQIVLAAIASLAAAAIVLLLTQVWNLPAPGDISRALTQNPDNYTLSLGHMGDLTIASFAYLRLPLMIAGIAFLVGARSSWRGSTTGAVVMMILFFQAARLALVAFDPYLSSRPLAEALNRAPHGKVILDDQYYTFSSIAFYARAYHTPAGHERFLLLNGRVNNLEYGSNAPDAPRDVFIDDPQFRERWLSAERYYVCADKSQVGRFEKLVGRDRLHTLAESGGKYVFANQ